MTTASTTHTSTTTDLPSGATSTSTTTQSTTDAMTGDSVESARTLNTPARGFSSFLSFMLFFLSVRIRVSSWCNSCRWYWGWSWRCGYSGCSYFVGRARAAPQASKAAEARWRHWTDSHSSSAFIGAHPRSRSPGYVRSPRTICPQIRSEPLSSHNFDCLYLAE